MIDYLKDQKIACTVLNRTIQTKSYSHAYLFETNGYTESQNLILTFVKQILCPKEPQDCTSCYQCKQIDQGTFAELKIIEPEGLWIKKEQLQELQQEFSKTSVESSYRVYIIHQVEKLNESAANSILKFLEEPEPNIIAILVTDNLYQVLDTIVSRCQIVRLSPEQKNRELPVDNMKLMLTNQHSSNLLENIQLYAESVERFLEYYELNGINTLLKSQKLWHSTFCDREQTLLGFDLMVLYYKDLIQLKLKRNMGVFEYSLEKETIIQKNTISRFTKKIIELMRIKEYIRYNVNLNLLMDKLIIQLEGVEK